MQQALALAARGLGRTAPNPPVGAVVVRAGEVAGRGWHHAAGRPHAEVEALHDAGERARGGTIYVTLEPCSHYGRTPPCTAALIAAGVSRVVYAVKDCDPRTAGQADDILRQVGIEVTCGLLETEGQRLLEAYCKHKRTALPFVTLKMALTLDGHAATREYDSHWITGEPARRRVHRMRDQADAVLVGSGTIRSDDPLLTTRLVAAGEGRQPLRVVVAVEGISPEAQLLRQPGATLIAVSEKADAQRLRPLEDKGAQIVRLPEREGRIDLPALLEELGRRDLMSVLVEGGPTLAGSLLSQGLVDKLVFFYAPKVLGDERAVPGVRGRVALRMSDALEYELRESEQIGSDLVVTLYPCSPG
ncbi:MAG TPA: bifunctional diaminohydroxyphosphoribosylaminopyrimidine deaminase/5-amino-6-(5-phosphoribosylamino)uracil reductase RibD [Armatimonadota bacterium]